MTSGVSVVVDTLISFYTLEPVIRELGNRKIELVIYCDSEIADVVEDHIGDVDHRLIDLGKIRSQRAWLWNVHRFLIRLFTKSSFSFQYRLLSGGASSSMGSVAAWLSGFFPGLPNSKVNGAISAIFRVIAANPFGTERLVTASKSTTPHLLCCRGTSVFTVLESWDHPVKWPVGHTSAAVFVWNEDLARDWRENQGDKHVYTSYPMKLRYWLERDYPILELGKRDAVYAVGTSSLSYVNSIHDYELKVIDAVCRATQSSGWSLLIKPKPNGRVGDFDDFASRYPHVRVGEYREVSTPADYYLDDEYNAQREKELTQGSLVINALTTLGLDAALLGIPCLQLDLRNCPEYGGVSEGQTNHHIATYLLRNSDHCLVANPGDLEGQLTQWLTEMDDRPVRLTESLRAWLTPDRPLHDAVARIADRILMP